MAGHRKRKGYILSNWEELADDIAPLYNLKPATLKASVRAESSGNPYAVSYVWKRDKRGKRYKVPCAYGIAQFTPGTGKHYGLKDIHDLFNPVKSLHAMARKLSADINTYRKQGDPIPVAKRKARINYNCGPGCVNRKATLAKWNTETPKYLKVIDRYERQYQQQELAEARRTN